MGNLFFTKQRSKQERNLEYRTNSKLGFMQVVKVFADMLVLQQLSIHSLSEANIYICYLEV